MVATNRDSGASVRNIDRLAEVLYGHHQCGCCRLGGNRYRDRRRLVVQKCTSVQIEQGSEVLYSAVSERTSFCFRTCAISSAPLLSDWHLNANPLLLLLLTTWFLCDRAVETFTDHLVVPFWHMVRRRHPPAANSCGSRRSLRQMLSSPTDGDRCGHPRRSFLVSRNRAPPRLSPALS